MVLSQVPTLATAHILYVHEVILIYSTIEEKNMTYTSYTITFIDRSKTALQPQFLTRKNFPKNPS